MTTPLLLVLDDEPLISGLVARVARSLGLDAVEFSDPALLLDALHRKPSLIVLDLAMPQLDGVEVLRLLAEADCRTDIVLMSGMSRRVLHSTSALATQLGLSVVGLLEKPLRIEAIREQLRARRPAPTTERTDAAIPPLDELRRALARHELEVHYQPLIHLRTRRWVGVEALVRWRHPERGLLSPATFIALAERNGLALALTHEVIDVALREFNPATFGHHGAVPLSINLPPAALVDRGFPDQVMRRVRDAGRRADGLRFEVTETSVADSAVIALDILTRLRLKGFGLTLDDFGTGHASLEMLHRVPFDEMKIDLQFVRVMDRDPAARAIVASSVSLAKDLGIAIVAEGIETERVADLITAAGADLGQGYYFARPLAWADLGAWVRGWRDAESAS